MNRAYRISTIALYFVAVLTLPWWGVLFFAIILIAYARAWASAIIGALVFDALYGAPAGPFATFSFPYLYTITVAALAALAHLLRTRLLE